MWLWKSAYQLLQGQLRFLQDDWVKRRRITITFRANLDDVNIPKVYENAIHSVGDDKKQSSKAFVCSDPAVADGRTIILWTKWCVWMEAQWCCHLTKWSGGTSTFKTEDVVADIWCRLLQHIIELTEVVGVLINLLELHKKRNGHMWNLKVRHTRMQILVTLDT